MPRSSRRDFPGALHHVFNRGIARRTVFETADDIRFALSLFAREVRSGRIRLRSYSFLTTHFHALVEAPTGELSNAMRRIMNLYVRRFNRQRQRDGSLFRGRFGSRLVESETYHATLIRYIDQNAPQARLASAGPLYRFGSALHLVSARRPPWLDSDWLDDSLGPLATDQRLERYSARFGSPLTETEMELVRERLRRTREPGDPLDDLVGAAPHEVRAWMERKALLADGTLPGAACAGRTLVKAQVDAAALERGPWRLKRPGGHAHDAWPVLRAGLLRHVAALAFNEIGRILGIASAQAIRLCEVHDHWIRESDDYAAFATTLVAACLADLPRTLIRAG